MEKQQKKQLWKRRLAAVIRLRDYYTKANIGVYAAQAGYFFMLSFIPGIVLLLTLLRYTHIPMEEAIGQVLTVFPKTMESMIRTVVSDVYEYSSGIVPLTFIITAWSAGKGTLAVNGGLNVICEHTETRNGIYLRIRASVYTVLFIAAIALSLVMTVFGNSIAESINPDLYVVRRIVDLILRFRYIGSLVFLSALWMLVYLFLPNRKQEKKTKWYRQLPGAVLTTVGWLLFSYVFSIYLDIFTGFKSLYGSLTTLMLGMLWLYICMYTILFGAMLNEVLEHKKWREDVDLS